MCGCGGNVYAVAVTSKRVIVQNDKRCMFGQTVLTTNEDSIFVENIHKASLFTDGSLNLGVCVLHSFDMLRGGFNWIFFGLLVDIILEWKPTWMKLLGDARLQVCSCRRRCFTFLAQRPVTEFAMAQFWVVGASSAVATAACAMSVSSHISASL
jgi:hypothetical protein